MAVNRIRAQSHPREVRRAMAVETARQLEPKTGRGCCHGVSTAEMKSTRNKAWNENVVCCRTCRLPVA